MKQGKFLIHISSLLFAILLSTNVYGNDNIEIHGDGNITGDRNVTGDGNTVCQDGATCNFYESETTPSTNSPNPEPTEPISTYPLKSGGYTPIQNASPEISNHRGLVPTQNPEPRISTY